MRLFNVSPDGDIDAADRSFFLSRLFDLALAVNPDFVYRLYRGIGTVDDVDYDISLATIGSSPATVSALGHAVSTRYTYALRPVRYGIETPDRTAIVEFVTDATGAWTGLQPVAPYSVTATPSVGGTMVVSWTFEPGTGSTPTSFDVWAGDTAPDGTGVADATATYGAAGVYSATTGDLAGTDYVRFTGSATVNGFYIASGTYNGQTAYERTDGATWIWWSPAEGAERWRCSATKGSAPYLSSSYTSDDPTARLIGYWPNALSGVPILSRERSLYIAVAAKTATLTGPLCVAGPFIADATAPLLPDPTTSVSF